MGTVTVSPIWYVVNPDVTYVTRDVGHRSLIHGLALDKMATLRGGKGGPWPYAFSPGGASWFLGD
jgi:hypothetical protein